MYVVACSLMNFFSNEISFFKKTASPQQGVQILNVT